MLIVLTQTKLSKYVEQRDLIVLKRRIAAEGITFLTVTLNRLDKGMLQLMKMQSDLRSVTPGILTPHLSRGLRRYRCIEHSIDSSKIAPVNSGGERPSFRKDTFFTISENDKRLSFSGTYTKSKLLAGPSGSFVRMTVTVSTPSQQDCLPVSARETSDCLDLFPGFAKVEGGVYPRLFVRAWENIFEKDGTLRPLSQIDTDAVQLIRQVSHLFYKLELPFTDEQVSSVLNAFRNADREVGELRYDYSASCSVLKQARRIVRRFLAGVNPLDIFPRHGSGSSACGVVPHRRYESFRYIERLAHVFDYDKYFFYNPTHLVDEVSKLLEAVVADPPAKAVLVPKDSRGPRLISEEPREFMYIQQGLMKLLYDTVGRDPRVAGQIGFTDQTRNQRLAQQGSLTGDYATLDLKEASDRVSMELVNYLFPETWVAAFRASRSLSTVLPDGDVVTFHKFAPMGSAVCFPVESICFWAISLAACGVTNGAYRYPRDFNHRPLIVSVFGDDIIVPTEHAPKVMSALEDVGLVVNVGKSFLDGPFRESCGGDYFNGNRVVPVRCKAIPTRDDMPSAFRTVEVFNNLIREYGYERIGLSLEHLFAETFGFPVPVSSRYREDDMEKTTRGLYLIGRYTDVAQHYKRRWNSKLSVIEYRIPCMSARQFTVGLTGWSLLLRKACLKLNVISADLIALPKRYRIKYRWTQL